MSGAAIVRFRGLEPRIAADVFLADHVAVIGDVVIGAGSSLWYGAVVRGDAMPIRIGRDTSIQDNSVVHVTGGISGTEIGDRVTVGHNVTVHACTVEDDCIIGIGSIILDRARIGRGSIIGAGALVTPGTVIPPGSMVMGAPAKVKRALTDEERERIASSAEHYVELARAYRAAVAP
jgi:carbonic anhydrase/acetyltransferase-like protein (isoleucine patch superfamily)